MFTSIARFITWWAADPIEGETDPIMMVLRTLANVDVEAEGFCTCKMDSHLAAGMLWGIAEQKELGNLELCLQDISEVKAVVHEGMDYVWKLDSWDIDTGLIMVANAFDLVPGLQEDCMNADEDWATLDNWSTIFWHPITLFTEVETNVNKYRTPLLLAALTANQQLADNDFFSAGKTMGVMLSMLTTGDLAATYW